MRSPEGIEYPMPSIWKSRASRLVWTMNCDDIRSWHKLINEHRPDKGGNIGEMLATTTFEGENGKTKLTIRVEFESITDRNALGNWHGRWLEREPGRAREALSRKA